MPVMSTRLPKRVADVSLVEVTPGDKPTTLRSDAWGENYSSDKGDGKKKLTKNCIICMKTMQF